MNIDISSLNSGTIKKYNIDEKIEFTKEELKNTKIKALKDVQVKGYLYIDSSDNLKANLDFSGVMTLEDDISLEPIEYEFSNKIEEILDENSKNFENILDLKEILWENIVLEIPLKFTKVKNLEEWNGDGWKLVSEDELTEKENPFKDLLNNFKEE